MTLLVAEKTNYNLSVLFYIQVTADTTWNLTYCTLMIQHIKGKNNKSRRNALFCDTTKSIDCTVTFLTAAMNTCGVTVKPVAHPMST